MPDKENYMNKRFIGHIIPAILALTLLLSACGSTGTSQSSVQLSSTISPAGEWLGKGLCYQAKAYSAPSDAKEARLCGDMLFYLAFHFPKTYAISNGSEDIYTTENIFLGWTTSDNDIWVLENTYESEQSHYSAINISKSGDFLSKINLNDLIDNLENIYSIDYASDKLFLSYGDSKLAVIGMDGTLECILTLPGNLLSCSVFSLREELLLVIESDTLTEVYAIDDNYQMFKKFETAKGSIVPDKNNGILLLICDDGVYVLDTNGSDTPLIIWSECSIAINNLSTFVVLENNEYLIRNSGIFSILKPTNPKNISQKIQVSLASLDPAYSLQTAVAGFNNYSDKYYIVIKDYSEGGSVDTATAQKRLNTDILSGDSPDMISVASVSPFPYIRRGLLKNLCDFMRTDTSVSINDVSISNALSQDGAICYIGSCFTFETLVGKYSTFGDSTGWSMEKYLQIEKDLPDSVMTIYNMTVDSFIRHILPRYIRSSVDWNTGKCYFDSPEFISLLKAGKEIRETPEDPNNLIFGDGATLVGNGVLVSALTMVNNVWSLKYAEEKAGCKLSFIGWPTIDGSCGSDINLIDPVGVFSQSKNPDGCWEFIKFLLHSERDNALPIYKPTLEKQLTNAGKEGAAPVILNSTDKRMFLALVSSIENVSLYDDTLLDIIKSEFSAFMNGDKTAEEAAKLIQSRASIYLAEQAG